MSASVEPDVPKDAQGPTADLWKLFAQIWDYEMEKGPISATMIGDYRFNDKLSDLSKEAHEQHLKKVDEFYEALKKIPKDKLSESDQQNYNFVEFCCRVEKLETGSVHTYEIPTTHLFGPHVMLPQLVGLTPFQSKKDCLDFLKRLKAFPKQVDQMIDAFREGIKNQKTLPKNSVETMIKHCENQIVETTKSPLYGAAPKFKENEVDESELKDAIEKNVVPAYKKLKEFFEKEYMEHARKEAGIYAWKDGKKIYENAIRYFTSQELTAEEIHEWGKEEVARITKELEEVKNSLGFKNLTLDEFKKQTVEDKKFYYSTAEEIIKKYQEILDEAEKLLPKYFGILPKAKMVIKAIESFREKNAPPAHYYPGSKDRPAIFYANTYKPETRPIYGMESIALHEGVPGHHLQIAISQELTGLPRIRKVPSSFCTGFTEGYALYIETFGKEMGFYKDPYSYFGKLMMEMWRAVRLVVDTGMHAFKWTREEAVDYFLKHCAISRVDVEAEVDRYMVFPGQALAYKIGERSMLKMRAFAEKELKNKFKITEFHDEVLKYGSLPLPTFENNIKEWVAKKKV